MIHSLLLASRELSTIMLSHNDWVHLLGYRFRIGLRVPFNNWVLEGLLYNLITTTILGTIASLWNRVVSLGCKQIFQSLLLSNLGRVGLGHICDTTLSSFQLFQLSLLENLVFLMIPSLNSSDGLKLPVLKLLLVLTLATLHGLAYLEL